MAMTYLHARMAVLLKVPNQCSSMSDNCRCQNERQQGHGNPVRTKQLVRIAPHATPACPAYNDADGTPCFKAGHREGSRQDHASSANP